jgi:hypothetical protein
MSEEENKELSVPVRGLGQAADEFSQAAKGAGTRLGEAANVLSENVLIAARVIGIVLAPLKLLVYGYAQLEKVFFPLVEERVKLIPEERRIEPPLLIAGPIVEAAKFSTEEPEICTLFANLLASSMDNATRESAHPAFVDIIKQLTPDEARVLKYMAESSDSWAVIDMRRRPPAGGGYRTYIRNFTHLGKLAGVVRDEMTAASLDNLCRLGLCELPAGVSFKTSDLYEPLERDAFIQQERQKLEAAGYNVDFAWRLVTLTQLGRLFCAVCVSKQYDSGHT